MSDTDRLTGQLAELNYAHRHLVEKLDSVTEELDRCRSDIARVTTERDDLALLLSESADLAQAKAALTVAREALEKIAAPRPQKQSAVQIVSDYDDIARAALAEMGGVKP